MNIMRFGFARSLSLLVGLLSLALYCREVSAATSSATEEKFAVLQVGTQSYKNVTVMTKAKTYLFITHSGGMTTIKPEDLTEEVRAQLGYTPPVKPKSKAEVVEEWAKKNIAAVPQVQKLETGFRQSMATDSTVTRLRGMITPTMIIGVVALTVLVHFFFSYCLSLICRKTGQEPGIFVWVPVLQLLPMLRAAGMSRWWFVVWFVPILQLVAQILWCIKIVEARGKRVWTAIALMLPITNLFAFLYLAFSAGVRLDNKPAPKVELMTLDTA